jgi:hypothetical protein
VRDRPRFADATGVEHSPERRFTLAGSAFGTFEVGDIGDCGEQPHDFAVLHSGSEQQCVNCGSEVW